MLFGERLLEVRKSKKMSQDQLAKAIGVHAPVIGRYERSEVKPSIDVAVKIANALDISLDYLVGNSDLLFDRNTLVRIENIQSLKDQDKEPLNIIIDAYLRDLQTRKAYAS